MWSGVVSIAALKAKRPYIFVGCFAVGMLVTPPDVLSQTILAIPMWLLFEIGLIFSKMAKPRDTREDDNDDDTDAADSTVVAADTPAPAAEAPTVPFDTGSPFDMGAPANKDPDVPEKPKG